MRKNILKLFVCFAAVSLSFALLLLFLSEDCHECRSSRRKVSITENKKDNSRKTRMDNPRKTTISSAHQPVQTHPTATSTENGWPWEGEGTVFLEVLRPDGSFAHKNHCFLFQEETGSSADAVYDVTWSGFVRLGVPKTGQARIIIVPDEPTLSLSFIDVSITGKNTVEERVVLQESADTRIILATLDGFTGDLGYVEAELTLPPFGSEHHERETLPRSLWSEPLPGYVINSERIFIRASFDGGAYVLNNIPRDSNLLIHASIPTADHYERTEIVHSVIATGEPILITVPFGRDQICENKKLCRLEEVYKSTTTGH